MNTNRICVSIQAVIQGSTKPGRQVVVATKFCTATSKNLWDICIELASCHPFGAWNFEVAPTFLENLGTPCSVRWRPGKLVIVPNHHFIKAYRGSGRKSPCFLISALNGGEGIYWKRFLSNGLNWVRSSTPCTWGRRHRLSPKRRVLTVITVGLDFRNNNKNNNYILFIMFILCIVDNQLTTLRPTKYTIIFSL
jgi:hypothetical protein